ncbi:alpha/beta hydrolase-fold protein [Aquimarina aquimarini]|uniref:alpha/beta hydrolase-fold protein n=1 Tax=Aquimarina aquimarini TaxID=1191734 RepID=UPI000D5532BD|nr:alpha/beta hydrolase-fold protein [Aquimarina aquimarini]
MNKNILIIVVVIALIQHTFGQQKTTNFDDSSERRMLFSEILEEEREFQVYLPPSYHSNNKGNFPVIYIMDGDYNFKYITGLVELLSSVSGKIPECIVVGIADKGKATYRKNCTPSHLPKQQGNASNFMSFIENELQPFIDTHYRASDYEILIGQSIGGLFVTNYLLEKPETFDSYIAIEPALWLGGYEIVNRADSIFKANKKLKAHYFVSLADTKEMGIRQLVGILDKHYPMGTTWDFMHFENENHNSVGLVTVKESLEKIFKNWNISREAFYSFKSSQEIIDHYHQLSTNFSTSIAIPPYFLGNVIYYYYNHKKEKDLSILEEEIKAKFPASIEEFYLQLALNHFENKEYDKALDVYTKRIVDNPLSYQAYEGISKVYYAQGDFKKALEMSEKSVKIAKENNVRQWMLNELNSNVSTIKKALK